MNWNTIWENTISGVFVVIIGGIGAWFAYVLGIRGKERAQNASARKQEIYIPLKYELNNIMSSTPCNLWKKIEPIEILKIVNNNDEMVVKEEIYKKCNSILNMINEYNSIDLYDIAASILNKQFEVKYAELCDGLTHTEWRQYGDEEIELEELDYEVRDFYEVTDDKRNIDNLFKLDPLYDEYCVEEQNYSPMEDYISRLFSSVLPKIKTESKKTFCQEF